MNKLRIILLTMLFAVAYGAAGQGYVIDSVCKGSERHYRIDGETGSSYTWMLTDQSGAVVYLPETADTVTIIWNMDAGDYMLSALQTSILGCDSLELGTISVFDLPLVYAGANRTLCNNNPFLLSEATASGYSSLVWKSSGDGTFDDTTSLNPVYTFGPADLSTGTVLLTAKATGFGRDGSCPPEESSLTITLNTMDAVFTALPASCDGAADGSVTLIASGGISPYSYTLGGITNSTGLFTGLPAAIYGYTISDASVCEITGEVIVSSLMQMTASYSVTNVTCFGAKDGSILIIGASGGSLTYEYSSDNINWQNTPLFAGLFAGTYTLYMRDLASPVCVLTIDSIEIAEPAVLQALSVHTDESAPGAGDGTITVMNQTGGSGGYEYSIDGINWQISAVFGSLSPGLYPVYMRDISAPACYIILGNEIISGGLNIEIEIQNVSCYGLQDGEATAIVSGGTPPYTYLWNDPSGQITSTAINLAAGIYTVIITDPFGNTATASDTITQPDAVNAIFAAIGPICQNSPAPLLPNTSINGISGNWSPALINTSWTGTTIYTFTPDSNQCAATITLAIQVTNQLTPAFASMGPLCQNSQAPLLPNTSINGISGNWSPALINTSLIGTTIYTFSPDTGQCAATVTLAIQVTNQLTPAFASIGPLCQNSPAPLLPNTSLNGISGNWSPALINTSLIGTTIYTFSPDTGQCAATVTLAIQVTNQLTPAFASIGPLCQNSPAPLLPNTSLNGISGNWNPALINTALIGTTIYTFTADTGQCAATVTMSILVTNQLIPDFESMGPLCQFSPAPLLPNISLNGISGNWSPALINTALTGTTIYTFTPATGQCATTVALSIQVTNQLTPVFEPIGPLCQNSHAPVLPATSTNGISGNWSPAIINTSLIGTTIYTFNPDTSQCAAVVALAIEVTNQLTPVFASIGPLCQNSTAPVLPITSLNGISGTWSPDLINTSLISSTIYTFTPDTAQCAAVVTLSIQVTNQLTPAFAALGPLCQNSLAPALQATSTNGISGNWNPALINTSLIGTTIYTFNPDTGQCAVAVTLAIQVTNQILPVFAPIGPLCLNNTPEILPATSINGISGSWNPAVINTYITGTTHCTFTPDTGQCAAITTLDIGVGSPEIIEIQTFTSLNGMPNGYAAIIAAGAIPPFTYSLDGTLWQNMNVFTQLSAGTYTGWVKDASGCIVNQQFIIRNTVTGDVGVLAGNVLNCISLPIEIPVMAYDFDNIAAFTIQLAFDSSVISFNGLSMVNNILNDGNLTITLISPGVLQITFTATDSITMYNDGLLFNLDFFGLSAGHTELQWDWLHCVIFSASGYELPAIYTKGAVEIRPAPQIYTDGGGEYCEGTPLKLNAESLTSQQLSYNWIGPAGTSNTGNVWDLGSLSLADSGEYKVVASDSSACARTETIEVQVYPNPHVNLADNDTICSEQEVVLSPGSGFAAYKWQNGSTEPQLDVTTEGLYWVIVTDNHGCQASDSVMLRPCELLIWMPNVFSPNSDGLNDEFMAKSNLDLDIEFKMLVFNKWGQELFSSNDIKKGWDGTFKGKPCPPDLYTWSISFKAPPTYNFLQKSPQRGNVMLLK
jgi:gliding motility-associated-like protein